MLALLWQYTMLPMAVLRWRTARSPQSTYPRCVFSLFHCVDPNILSQFHKLTKERRQELLHRLIRGPVPTLVPIEMPPGRPLVTDGAAFSSLSVKFTTPASSEYAQSDLLTTGRNFELPVSFRDGQFPRTPKSPVARAWKFSFGPDCVCQRLPEAERAKKGFTPTVCSDLLFAMTPLLVTVRCRLSILTGTPRATGHLLQCSHHR